MRKAQRLTLPFLIVLWMVCVVSAQAENLVSNASFEQISNDAPIEWTTHTWRGQAKFSVDENGRTGPCIKISSESGGDASWSTVVSVPPFARLRLSGWIRTENLSTTTGRGVLLNIHGIDGAATSAVTDDTDGWVRLETEFDMTGESSVQINCLFGGWGYATGTAWFDDIALEVIESPRPGAETVAVAITINPTPDQEPISEYVYGQFIEHLGRCIYGGIWAEMLEDRKFFYSVPAVRPIWETTRFNARVLRDSPWKVIGSPDNIRMTTDDPLSGDHEPKVTVFGQPGGFYQDELSVLAGRDYEGRIVLRGDRSAGPIQVSLVWGAGDADRQTVTIARPDRNFRTYKLKYTAGSDADNARLEIVGKGRGSFIVGAVSLMPADNVNGFRRDTLELLKTLNSPIYRWPGGNFVSGYDWRDGVGDRDRRPTRSNPAWTGIESNDVGMHEFLELCQRLNAEPMIVVNTGFGDAHSAAAQVEYVNGNTHTRMGKWRAENGHRPPFGVKHWGVGNEMFGNWQLGHMQLRHYVLKHNWVEDMMRKMDPTIITFASGDLREGWSEGMLRHCYDHMDYICEHFYSRRSPSDLTEHVRQVPNQIREKVVAHRRYRSELPMLEGKDIRIAMTEWNYWYGPHVFGELGTRYFMRDALGIAAGLHEYFRHSDLIHSAFYAQTVNVIGAIKTTKTAAEFDATAYPLILYRREFGSKPLTVEGWTEALDVAAALTDDGRHLTIGFVNATWNTYNVTLDLGHLKPKGKADGWVIHHENPMAYNHPGEKPVIEIGSLDPTDIAETLSIKPISITVFKVPLTVSEIGR